MWLASSTVVYLVLGAPLLLALLIGAGRLANEMVPAGCDSAGAVPALAALVLLLRRLPAWFLLRPLLPSAQSWRESLLIGWFGPIGIAGLFYATDIRHEVAHGETVWTVASLVVFGSILAHGATATPFTRLYGRRRAAPGTVNAGRGAGAGGRCS